MKPAAYCLCGCRAVFRRSRSLPLCKAATARLRAVLRERTRGLDPNEHVRAFNALYGSAEAARTALLAAS